MGPCYSLTKDPKARRSTTKLLKNKTPQIIISNQTKQTITKTISQITGASLLIQKNRSCVIMILDYSSAVTIEDCSDCAIFIAPCKGILILRSSTNITLISASAEIRVSDVLNSVIFTFTSSPPSIESSSNIKIGMFFIEYMELLNMFKKSELKVWENAWSEFNCSGSVAFCDADTKKKEIVKLSSGQRECYINFDQFQVMPFVYGKSIDVKEMRNLCIVLREMDCDEAILLKFLYHEELGDRRCKLIKTKIIKESDNMFGEFRKKIKDINLKGIEGFLYGGNKLTSQKSIVSQANQIELSGGFTSFNNINNIKYLTKGEFLFLWIANENDNWDEMKEYIKSSPDIGANIWITSEELKISEEDFIKALEKIFY